MTTKKTKKQLEVEDREDKNKTKLAVYEEFKNSTFQQFEKRTLEVLKEYGEFFQQMPETTSKKYKDFLEIALKYLK